MCGAWTGYAYCNGYILRRIRRCPPHPCQLGISVRVIDIADGISRSENVEPNGNRIIGIALPTTDFHGCDDFGIGPILIIVGGDGRFFRLFFKSNNAKPQ